MQIKKFLQNQTLPGLAFVIFCAVVVPVVIGFINPYLAGALCFGGGMVLIEYYKEKSI